MGTLIENPLGEVAAIFENCKHDPTATRDAVLEFFSKKLDFSTGDLLKIPSLNGGNPRDFRSGNLVRFRCMIQDMYDPEYFIPCYKKDAQMMTSLFADPLDGEFCEESDTNRNPMERCTWHCISIPGETPWVFDGYSKVPAHREEVPVKKQKTDDMESDDTNPDRPWCFPLGSQQTSCIVKTYFAKDEMRLNDTVEIVGILSHIPEETTSKEKEIDSDEFNFKNPPTSQVFRIHAVFCKKINHENPLLGYDISVESSIQRRRALDEAQRNRRQLMDIFETIFLGDNHCAEYLLMHLISRIYIRYDVLPLGKFSLNLRNVGQDQVQALAEILPLLVTKSHFLPLSLEFLNGAKFVPNKDYEVNRLQTGLLQLSSGTHLICDENAMNAGQLNSVGIDNLKALGNVIQSQTLQYNFGFHQMDFQTDIPVLYLSHGKGLIKCDFQSKMQPNRPKAELAGKIELLKQQLTDEVLINLRRYLTVLKWEEHQLSAEMQKKVQDDFVDMRTKDSSMSADDLHSLLVVARYVSLLNGQMELTPECWEYAKALETERRYRCSDS